MHCHRSDSLSKGPNSPNACLMMSDVLAENSREITKKKRSTEGCSKFKSPETRQVQESLVSTLEHMQVPKWDSLKQFKLKDYVDFVLCSFFEFVMFKPFHMSTNGIENPSG